MSLNVRDLIIDNNDREGIVVERVRKPSMKWIRDQADARVREVGATTWWHVLPMSGGSVIVPESLARRVRTATTEDVMRAIEHANFAAIRTLASLFPELTTLAQKTDAENNHAA